jgi:hypothetical protein
MRLSFPGIVMVVLGVVGLALGVGLGVFVARSAQEEAARAERLVPVGAAALEDAHVGSEVLVEGQISERNPALFREFVAYEREEYRGSDSDGDAEWSRDEIRRPPLLITVGDGFVQVAGETYVLRDMPVRWQESNVLSWNGLTGEGTKRYQGFAVGNPVVLIGTVVSGSEGNQLQAEFLAGGTRASFMMARRGDAAILPWVGLALSIVGLGIAAGGAWLWRRS